MTTKTSDEVLSSLLSNMGNIITLVFNQFDAAHQVARQLSGGEELLPALDEIMGDSDYLFPKFTLPRHELRAPHYRELMKPIAKGGKRVRGMTDPEMLMWLQEQSNRFPLNGDHCLLMDRLFTQFFPALPIQHTAQEAYKGAVDELYVQYKRKAVRK